MVFEIIPQNVFSQRSGGRVVGLFNLFQAADVLQHSLIARLHAAGMVLQPHPPLGPGLDLECTFEENAVRLENLALQHAGPHMAGKNAHIGIVLVGRPAHDDAVVFNVLMSAEQHLLKRIFS